MTRAKVSHSEVPEWASAVLRDDWATCRDLFRDLRYFAHPESHIARVRMAVLAARCGKSLRMVRLAMRQLEAVGLVRRMHQHSGKGCVQQYVVAWERAWGPPPADQPTVDFQPALMVSVTPQAPPAIGGNGPVDNSAIGGNETAIGGNGFPPISAIGGNGFPPTEAPLYKKHLSTSMHTLGSNGQQRARGLGDDAAADGDTQTGQESRAGNAAVAPSGYSEIPAEFTALAQLREAIGARGVLPVTRAAEERVRVWFAAGWTAETLADLLNERMRLAGHVATPPAFVLTVLRGEPGRAPAPPTPERPGDSTPCAVCGRGEWACGRAAVLSGDPHQYQAKSSNEQAGAEQAPTSGPVCPPESPAVAELGVLRQQAQELLEQALEGLPPDIQTFARTGG